LVCGRVDAHPARRAAPAHPLRPDDPVRETRNVCQIWRHAAFGSRSGPRVRCVHDPSSLSSEELRRLDAWWRAAERLDGAERIVICHLGAGASLSAVRDGRSVDTTMGFTPLEGLVMATRSGDVDPGLLMWLLEQPGLSRAEVARALVQDSGLKGLAGTPDMREVLAAAARGEADAILGLDVYVHRLRAAIAAMAASLGGLDALVFTGRVGERAPEVRSRAAAGLGFLGVTLDEGANAGAETDAEIGVPGAVVRTLVVESREDLEIARAVRAALA
jgi:acetate kinase